MADGASTTRAVLEVRSPMFPLTEEGQTVCRLVYEPMAEVPDLGATGSRARYHRRGCG